MSARSTEVWDWLRERYPLQRFGPLAVFLATAGQVGTTSWEGRNVVRGVLLALALVLQFRLWDDLESLSEDRREHPERVLCQVRSFVPFFILLGAAATLITALLLHAPRALIGYMTLCGLAWLWYRWLAPRLTHRALAAHGLLLKYPAFVALVHLASGEGALPAQVLVLVYLCFCTHELLHDLRLLGQPGMPLLLRMELLGLWAVYATLFIAAPGEGALRATRLVLLCGVAPWLLIVLHQRGLARRSVGPLGEAVFALSFLNTLGFTLRSHA